MATKNPKQVVFPKCPTGALPLNQTLGEVLWNVLPIKLEAASSSSGMGFQFNWKQLPVALQNTLFYVVFTNWKRLPVAQKTILKHKNTNPSPEVS